MTKPNWAKFKADSLPPALKQALAPLEDTQEKTRVMLQGGLTLSDNVYGATISFTATQGVEVLIKNPLGTVPTMFSLKKITSFTTGASLPIAGEPTFNTSRTDGFIGITVNQDLQHTYPYMEKYLSANQTTTNNVEATLVYDSTGGTRGNVITYSNGVFTVSEAGTYLINATIAWQSVATYTGVQSYLRIISGADNGIVGLGTVAFNSLFASLTDYAWQVLTGQVKLRAGATFDVKVYQTNASAGNRVVRGATSNPVLPSWMAVSRLYNDSVPTFMVTGFLWGG